MALLAAAMLVPAAPAAAQAPSAPDPRIERLLGQISEQRIVATLEKLGSFGTRNTLSSAASPAHGIGAARQWILDEMKRSSPRLQVEFDIHRVAKGGRITRDLDLYNVVAILPGRSPRRVYLTAHYDTFARPERPDTEAAGRRSSAASAGAGQAASPAPAGHPAPGVNDDGSGTALVMELARVFAGSGIEFDATLAFVAVAGEEQGLLGARLHAEQTKQQGIAIDAVLNNDMVGSTEAPGGISDSRRVRVFSEAPEDSPSRQLARFVKAVGARYVPSQQVTLVARHDRFGRGGDRRPHRLQPAGVRGRAPDRGRGELRAAAHGGRHARGGQHPVPDAERPPERGGRRLAGPRASRPGRDGRTRPAHARPPAQRLRCAPAMGAVARCRGVCRLLARGVDARLAARRPGGRRLRTPHPERLNRRSRVRGVCGGTERRGERDGRVRQSAAEVIPAQGSGLRASVRGPGPIQRGRPDICRRRHTGLPVLAP
ncbi:MAG: M28 family peptidase [Acidobacteria bacterium]|nr:M28 family peptidase [Acidobacteriota bacterium]